MLHNNVQVYEFLNSVSQLTSHGIINRYHLSLVVQLQHGLEKDANVNNALFESVVCLDALKIPVDPLGCHEVVFAYVAEAQAHVGEPDQHIHAGAQCNSRQVHLVLRQVCDYFLGVVDLFGFPAVDPLLFRWLREPEIFSALGLNRPDHRFILFIPIVIFFLLACDWVE